MLALMNRKNREKLADRIGRAAETVLTAQHYVSPIDVLVGIGWIDRGTVDRWRRGQIEYLERAIQTKPGAHLGSHEAVPSLGHRQGAVGERRRTTWRAPQRQRLRFSRSGNPTIERLYRTHWVSPELSERKRERLAEKASRAPGAGGDPATERRVDLPPVAAAAVCWSWKIPARRACLASGSTTSNSCRPEIHC